MKKRLNYLGTALTVFGIIYIFGAIGNDDMNTAAGVYGTLHDLMAKILIGLDVSVIGYMISQLTKTSRRNGNFHGSRNR